MSSKRPIIGLSIYNPNEEERFTIPRQYVDGIVKAGGAPILLAPVDEDLAQTWLPLLDGLVLAGGGDINPALYGADPHESLYNLSQARDATEMELAKLALSEKLPTLAICRGLQIFNIILGGSLHTHLPDVLADVLDGSVLHRAPPRSPIPHRVNVKPGSRLSRITGKNQFEVSSWHHQAIDRLGEGLKVIATAEDGCIEAVEHAEQPNLIAVQWHPELTIDKDPSQQSLFNSLVEAAGRSTKR